MNYYGFETIEQIKKIIREVCSFFSDGDKDLEERSYRMVMETFMVETQLGTFPDTVNESGFGIAQFDLIGFEDTKVESIDKYKDSVYKKWGVNLDIVQLVELRYNTPLSGIFCRLKYKRVPEKIPSTVEERAKYWKKYYNSHLGAGTEAFYIKSVNSFSHII